MSRPTLSARPSSITPGAIASLPLADAWISEALRRGVSLQTLSRIFAAENELTAVEPGNMGRDD